MSAGLFGSDPRRRAATRLRAPATAAGVALAALSVAMIAWWLGADGPTVAGLALLVPSLCGFVHVYRLSGR